jgi:MYXO-CTERM domain-containing protein
VAAAVVTALIAVHVAWGTGAPVCPAMTMTQCLLTVTGSFSSWESASRSWPSPRCSSGGCGCSHSPAGTPPGHRLGGALLVTVGLLQVSSAWAAALT